MSFPTSLTYPLYSFPYLLCRYVPCMTISLLLGVIGGASGYDGCTVLLYGHTSRWAFGSRNYEAAQKAICRLWESKEIAADMILTSGFLIGHLSPSLQPVLFQSMIPEIGAIMSSLWCLRVPHPTNTTNNVPFVLCVD